MIVIIAEFLTFSRGAWFAIAGQLFFLTFVIGGIRLTLGSVLGIAGCILGLWLVSQDGYLRGIFSMDSVADRIGCWKLGIGELFAHPLFGVGFGNDSFSKIFPGDPPGECSTGSHLQTGSHLHNTWLMYAVGSGFPALIFLIWTLGKSVSVLMRRVPLSRNDRDSSFRIAVATMVVGFWICAFFNYLFTGSLAYLFVILLASGLSVCMGSTAPNPGPKREL